MDKKPWHSFYDAQVPPSLDYPEKTLADWFEDAAGKNPNGVATIFFGAKIRYRKLKSIVDRFRDALADLGVRPGDRVALIMPNFPAYPIAHFAVMKLGAVLVPTNPLYVEWELEKQLTDSGAETAVILDSLYPRLAQVKGRTPLKRIVVTQIQDFLPPVIGFLYGLKHKPTIITDPEKQIFLYRDLMRKRPPAAPSVSVSPKDTAILLYTGGTTGVSKGAELTHRNISVNVQQVRAWLWSMEDKKETLLCVLPFFHSYGMTTGLHLAIVTQSAMLLIPRFEIAEVLKRIKKHRPSIFCGVPSMYNAINHAKTVSKKDVGSIRLCLSGGSGLPEVVQKAFESLTGGRLVEGYGLSETSPVTHVNPIGGGKSGTIGVPAPDTEAQIVDPETRKPMPVGREGELAVRGPQVMKGYWNMAEETKLVFHDGWFLTGDIAVMDEDGFFRIVDRKKDLIISAGMNIYPREVEEVLMKHPAVAEVAVVGIPSKLRDETVKAFIVLKSGASLTKPELLGFLKDKLAKFKIPKEIEFRESLPKSTVGKILKRVLRDEAGK